MPPKIAHKGTDGTPGTAKTKRKAGQTPETAGVPNSVITSTNAGTPYLMDDIKSQIRRAREIIEESAQKLAIAQGSKEQEISAKLTCECEELKRKLESQSAEISKELEKSAKLTCECEELKRKLESQSAEISKEQEKSARLTCECEELKRKLESQSAEISKLKAGVKTSVHKSSDFEVDGTSSQIASSAFEGNVGIQIPDLNCGPCHKASPKQRKIARWFCQRCNDHYCHNCKLVHDAMKVTEDHDTVKLQEFCGQCKKMEQKVNADWHCTECSVYLCNSCQSSHNNFKMAADHRVAKV